MAEWQLISTAPKDEPVDLWVEWPPNSGPDKPQAHGERYADSRFDAEHGEWLLGRAGFRESQYAVTPAVTHWMPLPEPPR